MSSAVSWGVLTPRLLDQKVERPFDAYPAVIFDLDGTLANSMPLHLDAWNHGLRAAQAPIQLERESFMSVAGMKLKQTIDFWNEQHGTAIDADTVIDAKNAYFAEHRRAVPAFADTTQLARELAAAGRPLAIASGGTREDVEFTLQSLGLAALFPVVVTGDDVAHAKPAPDIFLLTARQLGVEPSDCLVIEDSRLGVRAAEEAHMGAILLDTWHQDNGK